MRARSIGSFSGAWGAQTPFPPELLDTLYWVIVAFALLSLGGILWMIYRKFSNKAGGSADTMGLDVDFIERAENKGTLTKEEMRRVREAMVRRALESRQKIPTTVKDLETQVRSGLLLPDKVEGAGPARASKRPAPPPPPPEERSVRTPSPSAAQSAIQPSGAAQPKPQSPPPPATEAPRPDAAAPIDMKALLERGLINQEEYERLTGLARSLKDEESEKKDEG